jgi:proline racemase
VVEPETTVIVDVPSGRLTTVAAIDGGRVRSVRFRNVPSFVAGERLKVDTRSGEVLVDVAYGGAFYALVDAGELELPVQPAFLTRFIELGREVKSRVEAQGEVVHPQQRELRGIYGVIFTEGNRNVTVFADGEVDRSPCGSGTSARLALLWHRRELAAGSPFEHESIIGTRFQARIVGETAVGEHPAVITEIAGSAHLTGYHQFVLDPDDPLGTGFLLR